MDTVVGRILGCSLSEQWGHVLIVVDTGLNLDVVACKALVASVDKAHNLVPVLKVVAQALIGQHHLHHLVVANATMIVSQHVSEMVGIVGHRLFFS
jgi:hypothetical protein